MSKFREKWNNLRQKRYFRILTNKYLFVTSLFLIFIIFIDNNNLIRWAGKCIDVIYQEKAIRQYKKEIKGLDDKMKELTSNKDSLEKYAREHYYFQEPGEEIFIVE